MRLGAGDFFIELCGIIREKARHQERRNIKNW